MMLRLVLTLILGAASVMLLSGAKPGAAAKPGAKSKRRNLLYLVADDLRPEFLSVYGQRKMHTPHFDKLANDSMVFLNAYCSQASLCRVVLLSGATCMYQWHVLHVD